MLVVFVSWLSFFVDRNSAPARVSLGITTVLTMTTLIMGFGQDSLPVVSYMRALDLYLIVCYLLVFGSFAEYALVNYRSKPDNKRISEVIDASKINIYIEWKFDIFRTVECQSLFRWGWPFSSILRELWKLQKKNIVNSLKLLQYECDVIEEHFVDVLERRCTKGHSLRCQKKKDMIKPRKNQQIIGESSCAISIG